MIQHIIYCLVVFLVWVCGAGAQPAPNSFPFSAIVLANTTGVLVVPGAHNITGLQFASVASANTYIKFYDSATAPTCGTGTPNKRLQISAGNLVIPDIIVPITVPIKFVNGISYCVTGGITDTDTTAPAANQTIVNIDWQ